MFISKKKTPKKNTYRTFTVRTAHNRTCRAASLTSSAPLLTFPTYECTCWSQGWTMFIRKNRPCWTQNIKRSSRPYSRQVLLRLLVVNLWPSHQLQEFIWKFTPSLNPQSFPILSHSRVEPPRFLSRLQHPHHLACPPRQCCWLPACIRDVPSK